MSVPEEQTIVFSSISVKDRSIDSSWAAGFLWPPTPSSSNTHRWVDKILSVSEAMARTSEWLQQQSTLDKEMNQESGADPLPPVTPPPRGNDDKGRAIRRDLPRNGPSTHQDLPRYRYDIATLLHLRHTQGAVPVMLRVKPEAIAENIFQYMGAATSRRVLNRSHGLSDISNVSHGSIGSFNNFGSHPGLAPKYTNVPRQQCQAPSALDIPSSQRADGFVRFLQQHASPPNHRVTAGGRIVPAGPTSPPPMLDYGSLTGLVRERAAAAGSAQNEGRSALSAFKLNNSQSRMMAPMNSRGYLPNQGGSMASQTGYTASSAQAAATYENIGTGYQPIVTPTIQAPATMTPLGVFPDGSTLVFYNGFSYRSYWNGLYPVMEPLSPALPLIEQAEAAAAHAHTPYSISTEGFPPSSAQPGPTSIPLTNITNGSRGSNRKTSDSQSIQPPSDNETELKSQLTDLDKHLALYHFEILPAERAELVAHRRYLVEAIDQIRVSKEKPTRSIPIVAPTPGMPITPVPGPKPDSIGNGSRFSGLRNLASQDHANGKGLSPAAVPFIPRNLRNAASEQSTKRTLENVTNAAIARKDNALNAYTPSGSTQVNSHRELSSSSALDPSDPAMRVVDHEDIEYAGRYLYNWGLHEKRYCTTVAEFQEAIRQVREHARRYGCSGGSSKDPAYDAEQDIWWAICDRDPIPLPPAQPDYQTNPRPWSWEDSVFNYRRQGAPSAGRGVDDARNSPRLMGWDPATTERMKDKCDVTRSYFAYKGQLPSIPFRTWAFDRKGNRVATDPGNDNTGGNDSAEADPSYIRPLTASTEADTRKAATALANALHGLSTTKVSDRHESPGAISQFVGMKKLTLSGDVTPHPMANTPKTKGGPAAVNSPLANSDKANNESKYYKTPPHSYQPYVEDYPKTPTKSHSRLGLDTSRSRTNPRNPSPSMISKAETPVPSRKMVDESAADPNSDFMSPNHAEFLVGNSHNHSAETKSPWGPEEESRSMERNESFDHLQKVDPMGKYRKNAKPAIVNIPIATNLHSSIEPDRDTKKVKSVNTLISESSGAHNFLRKMLQSPTYATAKPPTGVTSGLADRLSRFIRGGGEDAAQRSVNKENTPSNNAMRPTGSTTSGKHSRFEFASSLKSDANTVVTKAQSCLVSSSNQAVGLSSAHVEAAMAYTASPYPHSGDEASVQHSPTRVGLPSSTPSSDFIATPTSSAFQDYDDLSYYDSTATRHAPAGFGLDGTEDPQPSNDKQGPQTTQQARPGFDYKGVTEADYEIKREDPDSSWHKGAVEDFFKDLAAKQREEVMSRRQSSSRRRP